MSEVRTVLDERFSEPGATVTDWNETRALLQSAQLAWVSTVRADGRPHVTPVVPVWLNDQIYFTTGPGEQKALNLSANASVALTTGCNEWEQGADVVVEGTARRVTDRNELTQLAEAWKQRWDGRWQFAPGDGVFEYPGGESLVFELVPAKVLVFGRGVFSHTRHSFS